MSDRGLKGLSCLIYLAIVIPYVSLPLIPNNMFNMLSKKVDYITHFRPKFHFEHVAFNEVPSYFIKDLNKVQIKHSGVLPKDLDVSYPQSTF